MVCKCRREIITWEENSPRPVYSIFSSFGVLFTEKVPVRKEFGVALNQFSAFCLSNKERENANQLFYFTLKQTFCSTVLCSLMSFRLAIGYLNNMFMLRSTSFLKLKSTLILVHMFLLLLMSPVRREHHFKWLQSQWFLV